jgi:N-acyl-L-homoserine lactone synthetase
MIIVVEQHNVAQYTGLIRDMFRLRARVFRDTLHWDVKVTAGMERDIYDDQHPVYIIYTDATKQTLIGSLRLLPTTGPTLVSDVFADTYPDIAGLTAPTIWECTRFCLDETVIGDKRDGVVAASAMLIAALGELALRAGIESIVGNLDARMLRLYRRLGCQVEVLGSTGRYGRTVFLGLFPVSKAILSRIKKRMSKAFIADLDRPGHDQLAA